MKKLTLKERKQVKDFAKKLVKKKSLNEAGGKNPELDRKVTNFIKGLAKLYGYQESDAVYAVIETIKNLYKLEYHKFTGSI